jgi:hypothetical protein
MDHLPTKSKFWLNLTGWDIDEDSEYVQDPTAYHHIMRTSVEEQSDAEQSDQHSTPPFFDRIKEPSPPIDFTFKPKHPIASLDYNSQLPSSPILDALKRRQQSPSMVSEPPISPNLGNASVLETPKKRKRVEFQTGNKTSKDDPPAPPKKRSKRLAEKGLKRKAQDNQSADEILPPSKKSKIQQASKPTQRTRSMKTRLQKSPNDSDSDDDFSFLCRCGAGANGMRLEASGKAAKCDECGFWSHIACLQGVGGRHSDVRRHVDHWECYICMTPDEAIRRSDAA